jgi:uncharacterized protein (DUF1501 family)
MIVPYGEDIYYQERPSLAIPRPDDHRTELRRRAVDLDGFFGLQPSLTALLPVWQAGHLAAIHAVGSPGESRSHLEAMELIFKNVVR